MMVNLDVFELHAISGGGNRDCFESAGEIIPAVINLGLVGIGTLATISLLIGPQRTMQRNKQANPSYVIASEKFDKISLFSALALGMLLNTGNIVNSAFNINNAYKCCNETTSS